MWSPAESGSSWRSSLGGLEDQNGTAPSPFHEATSRRSFALTPLPERTQVRPSRNQVTIASSVCGRGELDAVLDAQVGAVRRVDRIARDDRVADPLPERS
jgi:hypothetical protein